MTKVPSKSHSRLLRLTVSALCLALCLVLPFLTGQIPQVGGMLSPMHIPVYLCGFLCGPWWAGAVGAIAPLLRNLLFHMPPVLTAVAMTFELAAYGISAGLFWCLFRRLTGGKFWSIYPALDAVRTRGLGLGALDSCRRGSHGVFVLRVPRRCVRFRVAGDSIAPCARAASGPRRVQANGMIAANKKDCPHRAVFFVENIIPRACRGSRSRAPEIRGNRPPCRRREPRACRAPGVADRGRECGQLRRGRLRYRG